MKAESAKLADMIPPLINRLLINECTASQICVERARPDLTLESRETTVKYIWANTALNIQNRNETQNTKTWRVMSHAHSTICESGYVEVRGGCCIGSVAGINTVHLLFADLVALKAMW